MLIMKNSDRSVEMINFLKSTCRIDWMKTTFHDGTEAENVDFYYFNKIFYYRITIFIKNLLHVAFQMLT